MERQSLVNIAYVLTLCAQIYFVHATDQSSCTTVTDDTVLATYWRSQVRCSTAGITNVGWPGVCGECGHVVGELVDGAGYWTLLCAGGTTSIGAVLSNGEDGLR